MSWFKIRPRICLGGSEIISSLLSWWMIYRFERYPVIIEKTSGEDDWKARVPREFGSKQQAKPTGGASSKDSPKSAPQRYVLESQWPLVSGSSIYPHVIIQYADSDLQTFPRGNTDYIGQINSWYPIESAYYIIGWYCMDIANQIICDATGTTLCNTKITCVC